MNLFDNDTKSANESAIINLPAGEGEFEITKAGLHRPQGKTDIYANFGFRDSNGTYTHMFPIGGPDMNADRRRIGQEALKAVWDASGLQGQATEDRLPNFVGKRVKLKVEHSKPDGEGRVFANVRGAWPATGTPAPKYHQPEDPDDKIDTTPSPKPDENPLTETPAPAPAAEAPKKPSKWTPKGKVS